MLNFVIGTAGTGKTSLITDQISQVVKADKPAILLVPEQFSFESERRLFRRLGARDALKVEVLSFTRLCDNVFRKYGGLAGIVVTPTSKYLLMSVAVSELTDQLKVYKKSAVNTAFLEMLLGACSELKTAGITPMALAEFVALQPEGRLTNKLDDLSIIYSGYQALLENGYSDPDDHIIRACEMLESNNFFSDIHVFVDGFTTFMAGEFELLGHIIRQAQSVNIALTTDSLMDNQDGTGVFSVVKSAANRLMRQAEEGGVEVSAPVVLWQAHRYKNEELEFLSRQLFSPGHEGLESCPANIKLSRAADQYQELLTVAAIIKKLVREEGYRYKEIGVIGRNPSDYSRMIDLVFRRYEIPFFDDRKLDVENTPLIFGVTTALGAVSSNFGGEEVLLTAKSPIMGLELEKVAQLENYCYIWQIRGQLWQSDFVGNPRGLVENTTDEDKRQLEAINKTRRRIITPLVKLKKSLTNVTGASFASGLFSFLEEINAGGNLSQYANGLGELEKGEFLRVNSQLWDSLMDIMDIFGEVLGSSGVSTQRVIELFRLAVTATDIGIIPQTLDQVLVGGADRIRPEQLRAVFIIGANEGVFPSGLGGGGVFSQQERVYLTEAGLEIWGDNFSRGLLEKFYCYFAMTLPSERLYVSYIEADLQGATMLPSVIVSQLEELFVQLDYYQPIDEDFIDNKHTAAAFFAEKFREDTPLRATLGELIAESDGDMLERLDSAAWKPVHRLENEKLSASLFGRHMRLSPSRVERFYRCPFAYFAQDGLKLKARRKVEFSPLESGSVIHYVLQVMLQRHGGKGLAERSQQELQQEVSQIIVEYLEARTEGGSQLSYRMKFLFNRLCSTLAKLLEHLGREFAQSLYDPIGFEMEIGTDKEIEPIQLVAPDGSSVIVEGIIDRVDIMEKNGEKYVRVVDYKSGSKDFKLQDVLHGLNLQMLLYLFTISERGEGELEGAVPAGVLYMPIRESYSSVERSTGDQEARALLGRQWSMSGLLLDDDEALRGMEEELAGVFIPARVKKDGNLDARSAVATNEELGRLSQLVKEQIGDMARALGQGKIPAFPVNNTDYPTCSYCDYRTVCGYEEGDPIRAIDQLSQSEIMAILKEKEEEDG